MQGHDGAALEGGLAASAGGDGASLGAAVAGLAAAIAAFDDVDLAAESDEALRAAAVELPRQVAAAQARLVDVVAGVDRRFAYEADGAVSAAAWLRGRVNCEAGEASRIVSAGRRLRRLPALAAAFAAGDVGLAHVTAITSAAIRQACPPSKHWRAR